MAYFTVCLRTVDHATQVQQIFIHSHCISNAVTSMKTIDACIPPSYTLRSSNALQVFINLSYENEYQLKTP